MSGLKMTFKIIELLIAASIPVLIAVFGFRLTGKIEDTKNASASKYLWRTKWMDFLFQNHLAYCDNVFEFTVNLTYIIVLAEEGKDHSERDRKLNENVDEIVIISRILKMLSRNAFGQNNEMEKKLDEIWNCISYISEKRCTDEKINQETILDKLAELNKITEKLIQEKFKI